MKRLSARQYAQLLTSAVGDVTAKERAEVVQKFLLLLQRQRALKLLPRIMTYVQELEDQRQGKTRVHVRSAAPISAATLKSRLEKVLGSVVLETEEDPRLKAGLQLRVKDTLIDASLGAQLQRLHHQLVSN